MLTARPRAPPATIAPAGCASAGPASPATSAGRPAPPPASAAAAAPRSTHSRESGAAACDGAAVAPARSSAPHVLIDASRAPRELEARVAMVRRLSQYASSPCNWHSWAIRGSVRAPGFVAPSCTVPDSNRKFRQRRGEAGTESLGGDRPEPSYNSTGRCESCCPFW